MNDQAQEQVWHTLDADEAAARLGADTQQGLSSAAVAERFAEYGPNELHEAARRSVGRMLLGQLSDFMILVLIVAAFVSGVVGEPADTIAIFVIVFLNALVGTVQEYRAERAVAALKAMAAPEAQVLRDGQTRSVTARDLVPGDIVLLEAGDVVPADLRLLEAVELKLDESALTGESLPVNKLTETLHPADLPLGDRYNLAYKGTLVTSGRGRGVVVATGMASELGKIAALLGEAEAGKTPLQKRLARFGQRLALAVLGISALIFITGLLRGEPVALMFLTAVSLAVAAIPEALPAVVTMSLAIGARKMSRRQALIRRLPAVETLGSVTYICADKTGTLTRNQMHLETLYVDGAVHEGLPAQAGDNELWDLLGRVLALSNDAGPDEDGGVSGDPTEVALYRAAAAGGYDKRALEPQWPRLAEIPFEAERQCMTTLHRNGDGIVIFTKGSPEKVVGLCREVLTTAGTQALDGAAMLAQGERMAAEGYRVLALAYRRDVSLPEPLAPDRVERDLILLGLVGLIDPPRDEVPAAVADCLAAGITPVMITGDHPGTARAIALRLGIAGPDDSVITGDELADLPLPAFEARVENIRVYARVSPAQKIKIVQALQDRGQFVAMTGDGVNDAPALKHADIGVAMGQKGTDVAREAADMVLLDDNFATIVSAVREGRRIFDNIRKFIKYTMSSNSGEIWTLFLAPFLGLPIPLLPIHILWINLVTDGLPGLAMTAERTERGIMQRRPRPPDESVFAHGMWQHIIWVGLFLGGISIASQAWAIGRDVAYWQTVVFTVLTVSQLFHSLAVRSERESLFTQGLTSNPSMLGAVLLTLVMQLAVIYLPPLQTIFHTQALPLYDLLVCLGLSSLVLWAVELEKWLVRRGLIYRQSVPM